MFPWLVFLNAKRNGTVTFTFFDRFAPTPKTTPFNRKKYLAFASKIVAEYIKERDTIQ